MLRRGIATIIGAALINLFNSAVGKIGTKSLASSQTELGRVQSSRRRVGALDINSICFPISILVSAFTAPCRVKRNSPLKKKRKEKKEKKSNQIETNLPI